MTRSHLRLPRSAHRLTLTIIAAAALSTLALSACGGPERSAAAYCKAYHSGFDRIKSEHPDVDQYSSTQENPLLLLLNTVSAYGDVIALIGDMAKVAPDEIQSDTQRVHDSLKKQLDDLGDTAGDAVGLDLGGLFGHAASSFIDALTNSGAMTRMGKYVFDHCGEHMFRASPQR
jgi:hypothetical protein